jgi:hypothetical protein
MGLTKTVSACGKVHIVTSMMLMTMESICFNEQKKLSDLTRYPRVQSRLSWGFRNRDARIRIFCKNRSNRSSASQDMRLRQPIPELLSSPLRAKNSFYFFHSLLLVTPFWPPRTRLGRHGIDRGDDHQPRVCVCAHAESGLGLDCCDRTQTFLEPRVRSVRTPDRTSRDD